MDRLPTRVRATDRRCTGRAPLCITAGYNLLTGGIHHACVRARGVDTFPVPIFEPRSSLKDIRNLLSRWFIDFIAQFLQSCRWHCNSRAEEQLNKFFSGNYYYYLLFFFFPFYLRPGGKIKLLQHGVHGVGQETTGVSRWLWRSGVVGREQRRSRTKGVGRVVSERGLVSS